MSFIYLSYYLLIMPIFNRNIVCNFVTVSTLRHKTFGGRWHQMDWVMYGNSKFIGRKAQFHVNKANYKDNR